MDHREVLKDGAKRTVETARAVLADADAKAVLSAALPGMLDGPAAAFLAGKSFNDVKGMMPGGEALLAQLLTKLNQLC